MALVIVEVPPQRLAGVRGVVPSSFSEDATSADDLIQELWARLRDVLGAELVSSEPDFIGVTTPYDDHVPPKRIQFVAAISIPDSFPIQAELEEVALIGGTYAVFAYEGPGDGLDDFYRKTYLEELPASDWRSRDGQHLEKVLPGSTNHNFKVEAWVPVELKTGDDVD